jgi:hypothetical protein
LIVEPVGVEPELDVPPEPVAPGVPDTVPLDVVDDEHAAAMTATIAIDAAASADLRIST